MLRPAVQNVCEAVFRRKQARGRAAVGCQDAKGDEVVCRDCSTDGAKDVGREVGVNVDQEGDTDYDVRVVDCGEEIHETRGVPKNQSLEAKLNSKAEPLLKRED